jgi:hypothetical protein
MDGATSITIGGSVNGVVIPAQSVSTVEPYVPVYYSWYLLNDDGTQWTEFTSGGAGSDSCGAGNIVAKRSYDNETRDAWVSLRILKKDEECKVALNVSYSYHNANNYAEVGSGEQTIPLADLIGTHSFTFSIKGCTSTEVGFDEESGAPIYQSECSTFQVSAEITIS